MFSINSKLIGKISKRKKKFQIGLSSIVLTLYIYMNKDGNPSTKSTRHVEANVNT